MQFLFASGVAQTVAQNFLTLLSPIYLPFTRKEKRAKIQIFPDWGQKSMAIWADRLN
jgi:hypothetical protein